MGEMIYHGKVKQVWTTEDPDVIEFRYTDQISVFDQIIPSLVPRKGESLNRTSCHGSSWWSRPASAKPT
jgi:phosphoribosylaminoimidazole-succinocarboxamide synthase